MSGEFDDYEEVAASDDREEGDDARAAPFPNPPLEDCPIVPLGFLGGRVVFAMPEGEIRSELASKVSGMLRTDLFACSAGQAFLTYWRDKEDKFSPTVATIWLVRKCREAGKWDSSRPMRSLGLWRDAERIVLHMGDAVWRLERGKKAQTLSIIEAIRERSGPIYELRPPAPRPGKAASAADCQWARDTLDLWNFEPVGGDGLTGADIVAGWLMAALLGAAAPFRGHLLVNALAGSGKTTLVQFVHALLSALAGDVIDSFSEAGLKNDLAGKARPVLLDETEASAGIGGPGVVERVLEMFRRMATGNGGSRRQGDIGGGVVSQTAVGAVMMAAINPPKLLPADASRMVEVRLMPLRPDGGVTRVDLEAAIDKARALAPAMLGRAIKGAWRYRDDVDELAAALARAGHDPRTADLVSMLAAGRRLLLFDAPLTADDADAEVAFWRPLLAQRSAADIVTNSGADALAHLMASEAGLQMNNGRRESLGGLLERWMKREREYDDLLAMNGLRVLETHPAAPAGCEGPWLLVANHHPKLEAIFRPTVWGDWRRALGYIDALGPEFKTWSPPNSYRFGVGCKQRAIAIPLTPWFEAKPAARMAPGIVPLPSRSSPVPPPVPEEDLDWPD